MTVLVFSENQDLLYSFLTGSVKSKLSEHGIVRNSCGGCNDVTEDVLVQIFSPALLTIQYLAHAGEVLENIETEDGVGLVFNYISDYIILGITEGEQTLEEVKWYLNFVIFIMKSIAGPWFDQLKNHKTKKCVDSLLQSYACDQDLTSVFKCIQIKPIKLEEKEKLKKLTNKFLCFLSHSKLFKKMDIKISLLLFDIKTYDLLENENNYPELMFSKSLFFIQFYLKSRMKHTEIDEDGALKNIEVLSEPDEFEQIFLNIGSFRFWPVLILMKRCSEKHVIVPVVHMQDKTLEILWKMGKLCQPHYTLNTECLEELKKMGKELKDESKTLGNEILHHVHELGKLKQESELLKMKKRQFFKMCTGIFSQLTERLKESLINENLTSSIIKHAELYFLKTSVKYNLEQDMFWNMKQRNILLCNLLVYDSYTRKSLFYKFPTNTKFPMQNFKNIQKCIDANFEKMSFSEHYNNHCVYFLKFLVDDTGKVQEKSKNQTDNFSEIQTICIFDKTYQSEFHIDFGCLTLSLVNLYSTYAHQLFK